MVDPDLAVGKLLTRDLDGLSHRSYDANDYQVETEDKGSMVDAMTSLFYRIDLFIWNMCLIFSFCFGVMDLQNAGTSYEFLNFRWWKNKI